MSCLVLILSCLLSLVNVPDVFRDMVAGHRVTFGYVFSTTVAGKPVGGSGTITYQDGAYKLETDGFLVYNDKETRCTINDIDREAVVETGTDVDYLTDPEKLLDFFGKKSKDAEITVRYSPDNKRLVSVEAQVKDSSKESSRIRIMITSMEFMPKGLLSDFSFDPQTLDNTYVITDLR